MKGRRAPPRRRLAAWTGVALVLAALLVAVGVYVAAAQVPAASAPWVRVAPMPTMRSELPAAVAAGRIYLAGGLGVPFRTLAAFEAYDPAADVWHVLPPLPGPRHHAGAAATDELVVVTGGFEGLDFSIGTPDAWAFEPASGVWRVLPPMPGRRGAHATVALDGVIYVLGGVGDDPSRVWSYDVAGGGWSVDHARLPTLREHLAADVLDGLIYVIGGRWPGRGNVAAAEVYDPATDTWTSLPDLPTGRSGHRAVAVDGRLHVLGGEDLRAVRTFDTHEVYDPATGAWLSGVPMVAPRHGIAAAALGGRIYVFGGGTGAGALTAVSMTRATDAIAAADALR